MTAATDILEEAERKARALLVDVEADVQAMIADARAHGALEGEGQAAMVRQEIASLHERMWHEIQPESLRAALRVARELLARELQSRREAVVDVACTALFSVRTARDINLRVHPQDAEVLRSHKGKLISVLTRAKDLEIREDKRVHAGGVVIETESGVIDAQMETQLAEIERVLTFDEEQA